MATNAPSTDRRSFLRSASALAAAGVAPYLAPASVFGANAPSNRITLGCIGVGNQGTPVMKRFLAHPSCQVLAVCDVNRGSFGYRGERDFYGREPAQQTVNEFYGEQKRTETFRGCDAYRDFRELLARDDIQAVMIATPDHWHESMVLLAADAGKDIYCEKPLSLTIGQGRRMVNAVQKRGRILQTGSHERSNPIVRQACELVRNGYIGEVNSITTHVGEHNMVGPGPGWQPMPVPDGFDYAMWLGPAPRAPYHKDRCLYRFRFNYDYSGGQVTNFGAHSLDMAQWGLNKDDSGPVHIEYVDAKYLPEGSLFNAATHTTFRCYYDNGVELTCKTATPPVRIEFVGTDGKIAVDHGGANFRTEPASLADVKLREDQLLSTSDDHQLDFLNSIKSRNPPAATAEIGHRSSTVCHLGNIAIKLKASLQWDPRSERFMDNDAANELIERPARDEWARAV
ncbi:MAG TPA: Gfo/Idh/MocA family oxidoreductase [Lacipirellulaceae bacterium]|nr:Gfo/Idh/MocA family oxidoreductase [Lacipirellulaceae bacterium]HMP04964.1 Gfo/Idh/MocA family oxidoreductase [Lacipirellulaceae bacterium]